MESEPPQLLEASYVEKAKAHFPAWFVFPVIQRELLTILTIMACVCGPDCVGVLRDAAAKPSKMSLLQ